MRCCFFDYQTQTQIKNRQQIHEHLSTKYILCVWCEWRMYQLCHRVCSDGSDDALMIVQHQCEHWQRVIEFREMQENEMDVNSKVMIKRQRAIHSLEPLVTLLSIILAPVVIPTAHQRLAPRMYRGWESIEIALGAVRDEDAGVWVALCHAICFHDKQSTVVQSENVRALQQHRSAVRVA